MESLLGVMVTDVPIFNQLDRDAMAVRIIGRIFTVVQRRCHSFVNRLQFVVALVLALVSQTKF